MNAETAAIRMLIKNQLSTLPNFYDIEASKALVKLKHDVTAVEIKDVPKVYDRFCDMRANVG